MKKKSWILAATAVGFGLSLNASGVGKGPPAPPPKGGTTPFTTPEPLRTIELSPVSTQIFMLPNGSPADFSADLQAIWMTVVTSSLVFSPTRPEAVSDPCNRHLELRAGVSTFQMDLAQFGGSFGYIPGGQLGPITQLKGSAMTKIGAIAMDFSLWQCTDSVCSAVAASTANQNIAGVNLSVNIDFGLVTTGASLIYNTSLGNVIRMMMQSGMNQLLTSTRLNGLPWSAHVKEYDPLLGTLVIDAGAQAGLGPNQQFEIYAPTDSTPTGECHVFQRVATVHTSSVGIVSSIALLDSLMDPRGIHVGDVVLVHEVGSQ